MSPVLLPILPLLLGAPDERALDLLVRAANAAATARYVGVRRVTVRERGQERTHEERVVRDGLRSRVDFAPGSRYEGQTAIEGPSGRFLIDPRRREIRALPPRGEETRRRLERFAELCRRGRAVLTVEDGGSVAGRPTRLVLVADEGGRPLARLSIDPVSAVVLRREAFGPEGRGGVFVFTRFEPRARIPGATFATGRAGYRLIHPSDELRDASARAGILVASLPPASGYRLEGVRSRDLGGRTVVASFYSGGGRRLTLFASGASLPDLPVGRKGRVGSGVQAQTGKPRGRSDVEYYRWRIGDTYLGLVGEETPARLRGLSGGVLVSPRSP